MPLSLLTGVEASDEIQIISLPWYTQLLALVSKVVVTVCHVTPLSCDLNKPYKCT